MIVLGDGVSAQLVADTLGSEISPVPVPGQEHVVVVTDDKPIEHDENVSVSTVVAWELPAESVLALARDYADVRIGLDGLGEMNPNDLIREDMEWLSVLEASLTERASHGNSQA